MIKWKQRNKDAYKLCNKDVLYAKLIIYNIGYVIPRKNILIIPL